MRVGQNEERSLVSGLLAESIGEGGTLILFKPEHVQPILEGRKTQTRRLGQKRWNIGSIHQCKTRLFGVDPFARVEILEVRREKLGDISEEDIRAEGYGLESGDYKRAWKRINGGKWEDDLEVWVVTFALAKEEK